MKSLESIEEHYRASARRAQSQRELDKQQALAAAPYAEALRKGSFTMDLLTHATRIGHGRRAKVQMMWLGNTLRLQAKERRLEMRPTPEGVRATFWEDEAETASEIVDLAGDAEQLAQRWLREK